MSPEDIRAAAATHQELGPEYSDAVVASFLDKVDREVAARVEVRLAGAADAVRPAQRRRPLARRRVVRDVLAAGAGALVVAVGVGLHGLAAQHGDGPDLKITRIAGPAKAGPIWVRAGHPLTRPFVRVTPARGKVIHVSPVRPKTTK